MIQIKKMDAEEIIQIADIDRSEDIREIYILKDGLLQQKSVNWRATPWTENGKGDSDLNARISEWKKLVVDNGTLLGAFHKNRLVAFIIYQPEFEPEMAWLAVLHVDKNYRNSGIGKCLSEAVFDLARIDGAKQIYVSSISTCKSVDFYRSLGFELTPKPNDKLFKLEPVDIHMIKFL